MPPEILPGLEPWFEAFWELGTDRQIGQVVGPIPAASIDRHTAGWPDAEAQAFRRCIRAMDQVFLKSQRGSVSVPESEDPARDAFRSGMRRLPAKKQ